MLQVRVIFSCREGLFVQYPHFVSLLVNFNGFAMIESEFHGAILMLCSWFYTQLSLILLHFYFEIVFFADCFLFKKTAHTGCLFSRTDKFSIRNLKHKVGSRIREQCSV